MTCQQAKEISIVEFLKSHHIHPEFSRGKDHWYLSPLRRENTPSFKVDTKLNLFYDHGSGIGGDIIDLGCQLFKCDVKGLLSKLEAGSFLFQQQYALRRPLHILDSVTQEESISRIKISHVQPLGNNPAITNYIKSRGIASEIARMHCQEVYYQIGDKNYFAVGFKNRSGGYELRSQNFKGSSSPKDISHIENGSRSVSIMEGFMDFLSLLTLRKESSVPSDFLILNSVSFVDRSMDILKSYHNVFLYLDHDNAGRKALEKYESAGLNAVDASGMYQKFKDLNEYLLEQKPIQQDTTQRKDLKKSRGLSL
ncbi:toprim domain-containing protein [Dyadobacter sp. CY351]|uniref:toprim domain-containing protein n=1 Tax=Dyadobacter sp. CY351 TaxID=2909337 RepID=UPI001F3BED8C|nr:toprim domain-containing protein [Dyadobacter sp. CY351]MCF2520072.1 toprim domain-containing protein [Dyadobacter sp. CY351]